MTLRPLTALFITLTSAAACAPVDERPSAFAARGETVALTATPLPIEPAPTCEDADGDGFGLGCAAGEDCDDGDPQRAEVCDRCGDAAEGCPCGPRDIPLPCDLDSGGAVTPATCWRGQRTCVEGAWSRCVAYAPRYR